MSNLYNNPASNNSYAGIISALREVASRQGYELDGEYPPNYRGIIKAILDLQAMGDAGSGETPPGWKPEYDDEGNIIGGDWLEYPREGQLWFDTRQGRLFIWENGAFYQCNGADGLTVVGESAPEREVIGAFWYNTQNDNLYIYNGTTWVVVGGQAAINTASLLLANATTETFSAARPMLEDTSGLVTQAGYNQWVYSQLEILEDGIGNVDEHKPLYQSENPPANPDEHELWYDTQNLRLLVRYDGAWVPSAIPLSNDTEFNALQSTVAANYSQHVGKLSELDTAINALEALPHHTYHVATDKDNDVHNGSPLGLYLIDDNQNYTGVNFDGINGIEIISSVDHITFSTKDLEDAINNIAADYLVNTDKVALQMKDQDLQSQIDALDPVSQAEMNLLVHKVDSLPTVEDVNTRLSTAGGHVHGDISMNNHRITGLPVPASQSGAANKGYVDALRSEVETHYFKKTGGTLNDVIIANNTEGKAGIDFSGSANHSREAFKFKANVDNATATFGTNDAFWEYAWEFGGKEDFCWKGSNGKVVSITNTGLTASKLSLATFQANTEDGQVTTNKIDVGERLATYKTALNGVKAALQSATTFDEFKAQAVTALTGI